MPTLSDKIIALKICNLSKSFTIRNQNGRNEKLSALDNISFEVYKGEVLGIMGPNGSGKSTLLKIISQISAPEEGIIEVTGKVASILEVGTGFNPDLSGRRNVYLNARLHGMDKAETDSKFDRIVEMFGFPDFIDSPVKHYSSGMYMRLAFAVMVHIDADIYLFDEVLSVGDAGFKKQVMSKLKEMSLMNKTLLFVSHNPNEFINFCDKLLALNHGKNIAYGAPEEVLLLEHKQLGNDGLTNIHSYIESEMSKKQIIDDDIARQIIPVAVQMTFDESSPKIVFKLKFKTDNINFKISNQLIIKDKETRPLAQIGFGNTKSDENGIFTETIYLDREVFGPYVFCFDVVCMVNGLPAIILPQALRHSFDGNGFQLGLLNLGKLSI